MESTVVTPETRSRRIRFGQLIALGIVVALVGLFAAGIQMRSAKPIDRGPAPEFSIPTYGGGTFALAEQRGKVVVVNFWASWCIPCRDEAPMLERAWRKYRDRGVVFVGVGYIDTDKEAQAFVREFGMTYPNGPDIGTETSRRYRVQGVPETFFIGKDGQLAGNHIGPITEQALTARLDALLKQ